MENNDHIGMYLLLIGLGVAVWFVRAYVMPMIAVNNEKMRYQSMHEPMLFEQVGENDTEFFARVERAKARFLDVKNRWALKQIPVIAIPFNQCFTIEWFGKRYSYSTVGLGQMAYHRMSLEVYAILCAEWSRETNIFGNEQVAMAKGQQPFDPETIWNQN